MGNLTQSSANSDLQKRYKVIKQGHYDLTLLQELSTGNQYCLKCFTFNSVEGLEACVQKMKMKKRINHQHLLGIKEIDSKSQNNFCSNVHKVFVIIDYPFRTLHQQIQDRKRNWEYFNETQLWSILYSCSMALNYLYSTNLTHGCLTSNRIYIQNDGLIKLSDPSLFNENNNLISYVTKLNNQHTYLSPEQLNNISSNINDAFIQSSDVFVLGMIILQAIHLKGMQDVYDNDINYKVLSSKINNVAVKYSQNLRSILQRMLNNNTQERITFEQIETIVENNTFEDESNSNHSQSRRSLSSRKPLENVPSSSNLQNLRKDQIRPSKAPSTKNSNCQITSNGLNSSTLPTKTQQTYKSFIQNYQPIQPIQPMVFKKFQPIQPFTYVSSILPLNNQLIPSSNKMPNYNYTNPNVYSNYGSSYQFINPSIAGSKTINPTFINSNIYGVSNLKPYQLPPIINYQSKLNDNIKQSYETPVAPIVSSFSVVNSSLNIQNKNNNSIEISKNNINIIPNYDKLQIPQVLEDQKLSLQSDASPVERLNATQENQQIQTEQYDRQIIHDQPNQTIVEVTQTQISGVQSPTKQIDGEQLQYVNQDSDSGSHYQGYKLNGKKHGFGRLYYQDGGYYEGEWKHNKMDGFAKLFYQSGDIAYQGYWLNDKLHGKGKVYNDNPTDMNSPFDYKDFTGLDDYWLFYDGNFAFDAKQGLGTIKLTNGQIFQGQFQKDVIEGRGKYYTLSGKIINGIWKQNKLTQQTS